MALVTERQIGECKDVEWTTSRSLQEGVREDAIADVLVPAVATDCIRNAFRQLQFFEVWQSENTIRRARIH